MKVDFSQQLKNLTGEVIKDSLEPNAKLLTLKSVCQTALLGIYPNDTADGEEKSRRWLLAMSLESAKELDLDLKPEDVALMKKLIGLAYGPLVVGPSYQMLNG